MTVSKPGAAIVAERLARNGEASRFVRCTVAPLLAAALLSVVAIPALAIRHLALPEAMVVVPDGAGATIRVFENVSPGNAFLSGLI